MPYKKYETREERIERLHNDTKQSIKQRGSEKDIGMGVGASVNKAVDLVIALLGPTPSPLLNDELIADKIAEWTDRIYAISQAKKESEMVPAVEDSPVGTVEQANEPELPVIQREEK